MEKMKDIFWRLKGTDWPLVFLWLYLTFVITFCLWCIGVKLGLS